MNSHYILKNTKSCVFACMLSLLLLLGTKAIAGNDVTSKQVQEMLSSGQNFLILDIRTPREFVGGHLPGAVNADYMTPAFEAEILKLAELNHGKPVIVYCRTGRRSLEAMETIDKHFTGPVYHMFQGITAWSGQIDK